MANKSISGDVNVEFTEAQSRQSLESGESVKTLFGKLRKWLTDLGTAAFTNSTDYAAASHNQPSSTITSMTGYTKPQATSAITASDTLNEAIGKLEKAVDDAGGGLQPGNVDVSTNSVTLTSSSPTATVTLSNATGAVSILCSAENFEASLNGNTITINRTGAWEEKEYLFVCVAADSTHTSAIDIIAIHNSGAILCTWANGSDEAVASMIKAAHDGEINLTDYWAVGDERVVNNLDTSVISTSTITLKLYNGRAYDINDSTKISAFSIGVEGTSTISKSTLIKQHFQTSYGYYLSFSEAQKICQCLPQAIINNLLTQVITSYSTKGKVITTNTTASYAGDFIYLDTTKKYPTNKTSYSAGTWKYYYTTYFSGDIWNETSQTYDNIPSTSGYFKVTYLMCI